MNSEPDWWRTFFRGGMVEFWLRATNDEQTRQEADFIQQMLEVAPPARLLDVPCGGGRHSLELASRGFQMTGVDISPDFLTAARAGSQERKVAVRWEEREMRDLPWPAEFDGAFCFGNSFAYQDDAGNAAFLKAVARTLKPGARFLLETGYITETLLPSLQERAWYPLGDAVVLADRRYDHTTSRLHVEYTWIQGGHTEKAAMSARLYSFREVSQLLTDAGFTELQAFGSMAREPFRLGAEGLLACGRKAE